MPIRKELRHFYGPAWKKEIRPRILKRAHDQCEECGKPHGALIWTRTGKGRMFWRPMGGSLTWRNEEGLRLTMEEYEVAMTLKPRRIRVVICTSHLNHVSGDDRDENLRALCQWHHLRHDRPQHKLTRSIHKDQQRPLLLLEAS